MSSIDVNFFFLFWHVLIFIYTFLCSFFLFKKFIYIDVNCSSPYLVRSKHSTIYLLLVLVC